MARMTAIGRRSGRLRRRQAECHLRRLKDDRNQPYGRLDCPCWKDRNAMALFKEQLKCNGRCSCCTNPRPNGYLKGTDRLTIQERRYGG
jgi:hypothetical protein